MPDKAKLDVLEIPSLSLPYDLAKNPLDPTPRIIFGANTLATPGGTLRSRFSTLNWTSSASHVRFDRIIFYETLDTPSQLYVLLSGYNTAAQAWAPAGTWSVWVVNIDSSNAANPIPGPGPVSTLRQVHASTAPHNMVVSRGKVFIKGYPSVASGETLGTVVFESIGGVSSVYVWGLLGPTVPAHMSNQFKNTDAQYSAWTASANPVTVTAGWKYTYAYEALDGTVSNRAPLETNPSMPASNTGAFTNLKPRVVLVANSDTTNVPYIRIYRTMDNGGTFYLLDRIINPGTTFTYEDNTQQSYPTAVANISTPQTKTLNGAITATATSLTVSADFTTAETAPFLVRIDNEIMTVTVKAGAGNVNWTVVRGRNGSTAAAHSNGATVTDLGQLADPIPDNAIDTADVAPSLTSNSPPPSVVAPGVIGVNTPQASTPIISFAGRLWYAIGNTLFYSGLEEISQGLPEGAWPTGIDGNFYRFPHPIVSLFGTSDTLYIFTAQTTHWLKGTTRDTFQVQLLFSDLGAAANFPLAITAWDRAIIWLTSDYRIAMFRPTLFSSVQRQFLSDSLGPALQQTIASAGLVDIQFAHFGLQDREWLFVNLSIVGSDPLLSVQYVYDLQMNIWNTPWTIPATTVGAGIVSTADKTPRLLFGIFNTPADKGCINYMYFLNNALRMDFGVNAEQLVFSPSVQFSLAGNPPGNHLNSLRKPAQSTVLSFVKLDRTTYSNDVEPNVRIHFDGLDAGFANAVLLPTSIPPPGRSQSIGYKSTLYPVNKVAERVSLLISWPLNQVGNELLSFGLAFEPDGGR